MVRRCEGGRLASRRDVWPVVRQELPLVLMAVAASVVVVLAQHAGGAISQEPLSVRVPNAIVTYVVYIGDMFWPADLAHYYPLAAGQWAAWQIAPVRCSW